MALEFMDVQQKDNQLYMLLITMFATALGVAWVGHHYVSLLITGVIGLLIAVHLHREKMDSMDTVVCPIGEHCFDVITSKYSVFLGVSVEVYGILYYGLILTGYLIATLFTVPAWFTFFLIGNTAIALLFSAYLTWIQAVPLGKWCIWCVTSALACVAIFAFAVLGLSMPLAELLAQFQAIPHAVYVFSIALGMGAALSGDALFLKFLKDFEMSEMGSKAINTLWEVMWASMAFIVLGGFGYFYANPSLIYEPANMVSLLAIGILVVNGKLLYLYVSHNLTEIRFKTGEEDEENVEHVEGLPAHVKKTRRRAFMLTGISGASWLTVFFLTFAQIPGQFAAVNMLLSAYLAMILIGLFSGFSAEFALKKSAQGQLKSRIPLLFD